MPISIACAHCDWKGRVKDELGGKKGKCPTCGEHIPIPKKGSPPPIPKKAVDEAPDVVDDDIIEDAEVVEEKPRTRWKQMSRARDDEDDDDEVRPARSRRRIDDDDDDDRPRVRRRRPDDDGYARPRRKPKRRRQRSSGGPNWALVGGGAVLFLAMVAWWVIGLLAMDLCFFYPPIGMVIAIITMVRGFMGHSE